MKDPKFLIGDRVRYDKSRDETISTFKKLGEVGEITDIEIWSDGEWIYILDNVHTDGFFEDELSKIPVTKRIPQKPKNMGMII